MIIQVTGAILQLLAQNEPLLSEHLEQGKRNVMSTSKTTQNEIINIIGHYIRNKEHRILEEFNLCL